MKSIILTGDAPRLVLAGLKTQSRCVIKPQPPEWIAAHLDSGVRALVNLYDDVWGAAVRGSSVCRTENTICCPWKVGDKVWVKEPWALIAQTDTHIAHRGAELEGDYDLLRRDKIPVGPVYKACAPCGPNDIRWRSPVTMPQWASRLTLEITEVRAERLQSLSIADARAEGIEEYLRDGTEEAKDVWRNRTSVENFASLWNKVNRAHPWESNPFVWVRVFRVDEKGRK